MKNRTLPHIQVLAYCNPILAINIRGAFLRLDVVHMVNLQCCDLPFTSGGRLFVFILWITNL